MKIELKIQMNGIKRERTSHQKDKVRRPTLEEYGRALQEEQRKSSGERTLRILWRQVKDVQGHRKGVEGRQLLIVVRER